MSSDLSALQLSTFAGLGDYVATAPIAYALAEQGVEVSIKLKPWTGEPREPYALDEFPLLPLLKDNLVNAPVEDLEVSWQWDYPLSLLDANLERMGVTWGTTPRTAMLAPSEAKPIIKERYVLIAAQGNSSAKQKRVSPAQVNAVTYAANRMGFKTVAVGDKSNTLCQVDYDMRCATSITDLCNLIEHATLVVSTDTGILHIAGAYQTPFIGLLPNGRLGGQLSEYAPNISLFAPTAAQINEKKISDTVLQVLRTLQNKWCIVGPDRIACGVTETGRIMAEACGVEYKPYSEHDGSWCIAEYHVEDMDAFSLACVPSNTVVSAHRVEGLVYDEHPAILWRNRPSMRKLNRYSRRGYYAPLHTFHRSTEAYKWHSGDFNVVWHGQLHPHKGVLEIIEAWREAHKLHPQIKLTILGSVPPWWSDKELSRRIDEWKEDGYTAKVKEYWGKEELEAELAKADAHIIFDQVQKEQSGVASVALGYGKPVICSTSSAFDDVRGWVHTSLKETLPDAIVKIATDAEMYNRLAQRAMMGSSYRTPDMIARQYRAAILQAMIDKEVI